MRRLVQRLHSELKLPVYVLVDNDPWGFYIYSVMKQGSINLAYESMRMAVPDARFIGLSSFDKDKYKLPTNVAIKMDDGDNNRAKQMLAYPWFQAKQWQREIQEMVRSGQKFELEALSRRGISFITEEYLPRKQIFESSTLPRVAPRHVGGDAAPGGGETTTTATHAAQGGEACPSEGQPLEAQGGEPLEDEARHRDPQARAVGQAQAQGEALAEVAAVRRTARPSSRAQPARAEPVEAARQRARGIAQVRRAAIEEAVERGMLAERQPPHEEARQRAARRRALSAYPSGVSEPSTSR